MTKVIQPKGIRGSLKWVQVAVNEHPQILNDAIGVEGKVSWLSPLKEDGYAEYRDSAFLEQVGCGKLKLQLSEFWPQRGPQWDALGRSDSGEVLIVEAKAHIPELFSPSSAAGAVSCAKIDAALSHTANCAGAKPAVKWGT